MSEGKRARFEDTSDLKTVVGSQCLQYLTKAALEKRMREVDEYLHEYEHNISYYESQCGACRLPLKHNRKAILRCENDGQVGLDADSDDEDPYTQVHGHPCQGVLRCSWTHCPGTTHVCNMCRWFACDNEDPNFARLCRLCARPLCVNCECNCDDF